MKRFLLFLTLFASLSVFAQRNNGTTLAADAIMPVRGFCIAAPAPYGLERFVKFIDEELAPRNVNTLKLRVDYNYQYESYPNLRDSAVLSRADVKKLVLVCRKHIPTGNGHAGRMLQGSV